MSLVPLPPYPDLSFPREMDFCTRGGQGRVRSELEQFGGFKPPPAPDLAHGFRTGRCCQAQGAAGGRGAGAGLSLGTGVSQEWKYLSSGLEEDVHPESDPFHLSQAGGKSPMPSCTAAQTCAKHPQTPSSSQTRAGGWDLTELPPPH